MSASDHSPKTCFQGSTVFYDAPDADQFTPSYLEAAPLPESVAVRSDGTVPPWIVPGSTKSPMEQYVEWFNGIWHTGDPSGWNATIFTNQAVMIDPSGISKGAAQAAAIFVLLFKYYPDLRGEVVSWAANEREIFINWRFRILPQGSKTPILVAVVDKFCFVDGRVSFRLANFDIITFTGYLSKYFGEGQLSDYLQESMWNAEKTGGMQMLPQIIGNLVKGIFLWPPPPQPTGLIASPGDGVVHLTWDPAEYAIAYSVNRATSLDGPYDRIALVETNSYDDATVENDTAYWYAVSAKSAEWRPMPAIKSAPFSAPRSRHRAFRVKPDKQ